jgi:hypothetical protein
VEEGNKYNLTNMAKDIRSSIIDVVGGRYVAETLERELKLAVKTHKKVIIKEQPAEKTPAEHIRTAIDQCTCTEDPCEGLEKLKKLETDLSEKEDATHKTTVNLPGRVPATVKPDASFTENRFAPDPITAKNQGLPEGVYRKDTDGEKRNTTVDQNTAKKQPKDYRC